MRTIALLWFSQALLVSGDAAPPRNHSELLVGFNTVTEDDFGLPLGESPEAPLSLAHPISSSSSLSSPSSFSDGAAPNAMGLIQSLLHGQYSSSSTYGLTSSSTSSDGSSLSSDTSVDHDMMARVDDDGSAYSTIEDLDSVDDLTQLEPRAEGPSPK